MMYSRLIINYQKGLEKLDQVMNREQQILNGIMEQIREIDESCPSYKQVQEAQERFKQYLEGQPQEKVTNLSGDFSIEKERDQNYARCLGQLAHWTFKAENLQKSIDCLKQMQKEIFANAEWMLKTLNERIQDDYNFATKEVLVIARFKQDHLATWRKKIHEGSKIIETLDWIIEAFLKVRK